LNVAQGFEKENGLMAEKAAEKEHRLWRIYADH
jgi:hypothetical protein